MESINYEEEIMKSPTKIIRYLVIYLQPVRPLF